MFIVIFWTFWKLLLKNVHVCSLERKALKNLNHKPVNMALKYVKIKVNISLEYLGFKYELWPRDNGNNKSSKNKHTGRAVYILEPAMVSQFCYF